MFFYILIVVIIVYISAAFWKQRRIFKMAAHFKQDLVKSYPIIGVSYQFLGSNESRMKTIQMFGRLTNEHTGGISGGWFGPRYYLLVSDPELSELFLKTCLEKDDLYKIFYPMIGNGNFVAPVSIWRHRRKNLIPIFSPKSLNKIVSIFIRNSEVLVEQLQGKVGKGAFPIWDYLINCTMDSVCESVLGVQLHTQTKPDHPFLRAANVIMKLITDRLAQPWLHSNMVYKLLPYYKTMKEARTVAFDFINDIIGAKRKEVQNNSVKSDDKNLKTFLEQILESAGYSDEELLEESVVLVVSATDTTAIGTGFTLLMLAGHPDIQNKVYEELQEVFGDSERSVTLEDIHRLKYLEVVIKESLRLYPPAPCILRKVTKDVPLPSGVTVVEGCGVMVNIWALHRNRAYWGDDADEFRPERFLDTPFKHPSQFMLFSHGPRNCIGFQYALLSLKTSLATILRQFRILPPTDGSQEPIRCAFQILMKDDDDFLVRLESRTRGNKCGVI